VNTFRHLKHSSYPNFNRKVTIIPSYRCNQMCSFCEEYDNKSSDLSLEDFYTLFDHVDPQHLWAYFYGGEPTLNKHWEEMNHAMGDFIKEGWIQTQSNLSINFSRLETFCGEYKSSTPLDICTSYHLGKQSIDTFVNKALLLQEYGMLGYIFVSSEIDKEEQFIEEFGLLVHLFPIKVKTRWTETLESTSKERTYFTTKYPWLNNYKEQGFNFLVDKQPVSYDDVRTKNLFKEFRLMKCDCGSKGLVLDNNGNYYYCMHDFKEGFKPLTQPKREDTFCLHKACSDGLEFTKYTR